LNKHRRVVNTKVSKNVEEITVIRDVTNKKVPTMTSLVGEGQKFKPGDFAMVKENAGNDCIWK
jgi:hypothetical protein